jgi:hypothetical protein
MSEFDAEIQMRVRIVKEMNNTSNTFVVVGLCP